ncbi:hypothetical protein STEG23_008099, partial [Scotinomys teguina]
EVNGPEDKEKTLQRCGDQQSEKNVNSSDERSLSVFFPGQSCENGCDDMREGVIGGGGKRMLCPFRLRIPSSVVIYSMFLVTALGRNIFAKLLKDTSKLHIEFFPKDKEKSNDNLITCHIWDEGVTLIFHSLWSYCSLRTEDSGDIFALPPMSPSFSRSSAAYRPSLGDFCGFFRPWLYAHKVSPDEGQYSGAEPWFYLLRGQLLCGDTW